MKYEILAFGISIIGLWPHSFPLSLKLLHQKNNELMTHVIGKSHSAFWSSPFNGSLAEWSARVKISCRDEANTSTRNAGLEEHQHRQIKYTAIRPKDNWSANWSAYLPWTLLHQHAAAISNNSSQVWSSNGLVVTGIKSTGSGAWCMYVVLSLVAPEPLSPNSMTVGKRDRNPGFASILVKVLEQPTLVQWSNMTWCSTSQSVLSQSVGTDTDMYLAYWVDARKNKAHIWKGGSYPNNSLKCHHSARRCMFSHVFSNVDRDLRPSIRFISAEHHSAHLWAVACENDHLQFEAKHAPFVFVQS